jgi:hypothetical protein
MSIQLSCGNTYFDPPLNKETSSTNPCLVETNQIPVFFKGLLLGKHYKEYNQLIQMNLIGCYIIVD